MESQRRWYAQQGEKAETTALLASAEQRTADKPRPGRKAPGKKPLDEYTMAEREQIAFWMNTVAEWREFRQGTGKAADLDEDFVERLRARYPDLQVSRGTLYRKWQAVRADDWDALVDNRGKARKGQSSIHPAAWI